MASEVFRERPAFGVTVRGKPSTGTPPIGVPIGPKGFPPPPVPPPAPLVITGFSWEFGSEEIQVSFDREMGFNNPPPWTLTGIAIPDVQNIRFNSAQELVLVFFNPLMGGNELVVPDAPQPVFARDDGGVVAPGTYPVN